MMTIQDKKDHAKTPIICLMELIETAFESGNENDILFECGKARSALDSYKSRLEQLRDEELNELKLRNEIKTNNHNKQ